ncbi:MAG TPA: protein kinase [Gemmatimonadaceae bacterium]|nr:protein kinase [Gemmatimonadaceae bacterium]
MSDYLRDRLVAAVGDHFLIEEELGRGGMAAVFRALDVRLNRRVAIKLLPPDLAFNASVRSRFLREAQMAAQLTHPNIVPIFTVDDRESLVYFVMALVDGESLARHIARSGAMAVDTVKSISSAVADALDYAHRQGVVHRDIKPDNILLDRATGRPMVTDFGIARAAAEESRLTVTGMAVGTPAYMSPEQAMGERDVDGRSDIYSLGIVTYQMLAGETPFRATNTPAMLMKHVSETPPPLSSHRSDVPPALVSAVERALAKRPEDRWRSAAEMRDAILDRTLARSYPVPPIPQSAPAPAPRPVPASPPAAPAPERPFPPFPPPGLSRRERREWLREQRRYWRDAVKAGYEAPELPVEKKIARFRRDLVSYGAFSLMLIGINVLTGGGFPWAAFPIMVSFLILMKQVGSLWGDGVSVKRIFFGSTRPLTSLPSAADASLASPDTSGVLVTPEILQGPHGATVRRATTSRQVIADLLARMSPKEREMLPTDITDTVKALLERVASVAVTLHRLDAEANGTSLGSLDDRLATLKRGGESSETKRRIALLERQRTTLHDLLERRSTLLSQMDSAALALENLKLDLVRFQSAGVTSALEDVTSATREARAVSREIGNLLDAADEVKRL